MREPYNSAAQYERPDQDESVLGFSDLASLPAFIYLLFFLFVLVAYSSNPLEPQVFGFYKLSEFFKIVSFFSIFFVPTLLIYFALNLTKNVAHMCIVLLYPLLALGGITILNVADKPFLATLSGSVLFAFYFLLLLSHSATERRRRAPRVRRVVRPSPVAQAPPGMPPQQRPYDERAAIQRQRASQYTSQSRRQDFRGEVPPQEFRREVPPQYGASDGFLSKLDRFLDRYDYVDGEAVKKGPKRNVDYPRDKRRRGR
ncbi:MAG: hypothetical protein WCI87_02465 [Euryarchaeota archaeon]